MLAAFTDQPLGYDTIRIDVGPIDEETIPAEVINRLVSHCSNTLEVLEIKLGGDRICKPGPAKPRSYPPHPPPMTDPGLDLSPFRYLREISLPLMVDRGLGYLTRFSTIASGAVQDHDCRKLGSRAKELYKSCSGTWYGWADIGKDLLHLAVLQGKTNAPRVELVIDLRQAHTRLSHPRGGENKELRRNMWIHTASKHALPKFSRAGTIDFILPLPVSISILFVSTLETYLRLRGQI